MNGISILYREAGAALSKTEHQSGLVRLEVGAPYQYTVTQYHNHKPINHYILIQSLSYIKCFIVPLHIDMMHDVTG